MVLAIAVVGVLGVFSMSMGHSADPLVMGQATQLAQGELDAVIGEKAANGFATVPIGNPLACSSTMLSVAFNCNRNIYYVNSGALNTPVVGPTSYIHVNVTVTNAAIGTVTVQTVLTSY